MHSAHLKNIMFKRKQAGRTITPSQLTVSFALQERLSKSWKREYFRCGRRSCLLREICSTPVLARLSSYRPCLFLWCHCTADGLIESWKKEKHDQFMNNPNIYCGKILETFKARPVADQWRSRTCTSRIIHKVTRVVHCVKNTSQVPQRDVINQSLKKIISFLTFQIFQ